MHTFILKLVTVALVAMSALLTTYLLRTHQLFLLVGLPLIPFLLIAAGNVNVIVALTIATAASGLRVPGVLGQFTLHQVLMSVAIAVSLAHAVITTRRTQRWGWHQMSILCFVGIIILTIAVRGTGLRILGDYRWGGMRYVAMLLALAFYLFADQALSARACYRMLAAMCVLSIMPSVVQLIYTLSGGAVTIPLYFIHLERMQAADPNMGGGIQRLLNLNITSQLYCLLPFVLAARRRRSWLVMGGLLSLAFAFGALSGHRLTILINLFFIVLYMAAVDRRGRLDFAIRMGTVAVIMAVLVALGSRYLPEPMQRAVSWVPFAEVEEQAALSARTTVHWRLELWRRGIREVPRYLVLGKGYTYSQAEIEALAQSAYYHEEWAVVQSAYHNGVLSLLIGLGLPGLVFGLMLLLHIRMQHHRLLRAEWHSPMLQHLHVVFFCAYTVHLLVFFTLYGDAYVSLPRLLLFGAVMRLLYRTDEALGSGGANGEPSG